MRVLKISNRYEKMAPEQLEDALKSFCGLDDKVLDVVWKVTQILVRNCLMRQDLREGLCKDVLYRIDEPGNQFES